MRPNIKVKSILHNRDFYRMITLQPRTWIWPGRQSEQKSELLGSVEDIEIRKVHHSHPYNNRNVQVLCEITTTFEHHGKLRFQGNQLTWNLKTGTSKERKDMSTYYLNITQSGKKNSTENFNQLVDTKCGLMWEYRTSRRQRHRRIHTHSPSLLHRPHHLYITTGANFLELIINVSWKLFLRIEKNLLNEYSLISKQNYNSQREEIVCKFHLKKDVKPQIKMLSNLILQHNWLRFISE